jgi:SAM-dependent methyltransferase
MRDPYAELAPFYDAMLRIPGIRPFYGEWRRSLVRAVRARGLRIRVLVDLACGTGNSTVPWVGRNRVVIGVDRSAAMLVEARRKSGDVRWYRQDIVHLGIRERADAVTCHFDALNHIVRPEHLQRVFENVAAILQDGGLFQFDLNTVHMLRWLDGREKLFRLDRHALIASNAYDRATGIATFRHVWFVSRDGRLYERRDVVVRERAYSNAAIRSMLRQAGLRLFTIETQRSIDGKPVRRVYLAAKPGTRASRAGPSASLPRLARERTRR